MVALMEGFGVGGNKIDPKALPPIPATMTIDYVRVWQ
jgi:hypothetical protein